MGRLADFGGSAQCEGQAGKAATLGRAAETAGRTQRHVRGGLGLLFRFDVDGLGTGGRMRQAMHLDPFGIEDWDTAAVDRLFVTLVHAKDWKSITGEAVPNHPTTAQDYARADLPWFEHYVKDQSALPGGAKLPA